MNATFERRTVMALTGTTRKDLEYWDKTGMVKSSIRVGTGRGTRKEYSFRDIVQLKVAKRLRDEGISVQKLRKVLAYLRRNFPETGTPLAELRLVTNGVNFFVLTDDPSVILDSQGGQFVFCFALGKLIEELKELVAPKEDGVTVAGRPCTVTRKKEKAQARERATSLRISRKYAALMLSEACCDPFCF